MSEVSDKKILLVDDEVGVRMAVLFKLKEAGFQVLEAEDGDEALQVAQLEKPDLILLDLQMPRMDGMTMLKELRAKDDEWSQEVPVILLTNLTGTQRVADAMNYGVQDYLIKSDWNLSDVIKTVKGKLGLVD